MKNSKLQIPNYKKAPSSGVGDPECDPTLSPSQLPPEPLAAPEQAAIAALPETHPATDDADEILRRNLPLQTREAQSYAIGEEVARGGMGAVLQARESATRRIVAMKLMLRGGDARSTLRFIEEAQVTAQLEHPNVPPVHDLGIDAQGRPFYTMKLIEGITLKKVLELLKEGVPATVEKYPLGTLLTDFQKVCDALAFAHSRGVIHRDLKPANIMLGKFGEVLVMDWGLAKIVGTKGALRDDATAGASEVTVIGARREQSEVFSTMDGSIMGTPHYMSPEQAAGEIETLDARSDLFALGIILYEILTLERPFTGRSAAEAILAGRGACADLAKMLPAWQAKLDAWLGPNASRIEINEGSYGLNLSRLSLSELSPLRGFPLRWLTIDGNLHLKDLSPLADCPLTWLHANDIPDLVDLSPLKGKNLQLLHIGNTGVRDLTPLAGMQTLEDLGFSQTAVSDLTPIREAKLKSLEAWKSGIRSLEPLRGQPLAYLGLSSTHFVSLDPVGDAPLDCLKIQDCGHLDLSHLRTRNLRQLIACSMTLDHHEVLAEMTKLEILVLPKNLTDPTILRKLTHLRKIDTTYTGQDIEDIKDAEVFWREYDHLAEVRAALSALGIVATEIEIKAPWGVYLELTNQSVTDVKELRSLPIDHLGLIYSKVTDLSPLRGMRLKQLCFDGTAVKDVSPLLDLPILESAMVPQEATNLEVLRHHPTLKYLGWEKDWDMPNLRPKLTAAEFWARYDAMQKAGAKRGRIAVWPRVCYRFADESTHS